MREEEKEGEKEEKGLRKWRKKSKGQKGKIRKGRRVGERRFVKEVRRKWKKSSRKEI